MTGPLIHGNALTIPLASSSVHLVVTSPPYFALRSYRDGEEHYDGQLGSEETPLHFLAALWAVMDECWRVLRDDGSAWINLGDKFAGSGGHNNAGLSTMNRGVRECVECGWQGERMKCMICGAAVRPPKTTAGRTTRRQAPDRYNQSTGGLRSKSRMLLPHRFAQGCIDPEYRRWVESRITPRCAYCEGVENAAYCTCGRSGFTPRPVDPPQWICRMDLVWSKPNGLPESVTDRVRASHEYWFHLTKSERYYSALDAIREPHDPATAARYAAGYGDRSARNAARLSTGYDVGGDMPPPNPLGKLPGSVWEVATEPLLLPDHLPQHFAAFPSEWPRRLVLGWSPSGVCVRCGEGRRPVCEKGGLDPEHPLVQRRGLASNAHYEDERPYSRGSATAGFRANVSGKERAAVTLPTTITGTACACPTPDAPTRPAVVLDPFSGAGTTAVVASALGRHGVGVDLSWDYHRIARWRDQDGGLRAKALGVAKPEKQLDGQLSLLGEAGP